MRVTRPRTFAFSLALASALAPAAKAQPHVLETRGRVAESPTRTPATGWAGRLELRGAFTARDEAVRATGTRVNVAGSAATQAGFAGSYFPGRRALGFSGRVDVDRVGLRGDDPMLGRIDVRATALDASGWRQMAQNRPAIP